MSKILRTTTYAAIALALAGCKQYDVKIAPFNPRALQKNERVSSAGAPQAQEHTLPTTMPSEFPIDGVAPTTAQAGDTPTTGPALGSQEPIVRLPLRELVQRAVMHNLDVKVAGYQPAIDETRVTEAEAAFDPVFFSNFTYSVDNTLGPSSSNIFAQSNEVTTFRTYGSETGIRQQLDTGGRLEMKYNTAQSKREPGGGLDPNPFWTSDLLLQFTQPILRDFGADVNNARIIINRNNQRVSLLDFRSELEKNVSDLERAYWQLVQAMQEVRIAEELLDRTLRTATVLHNRIKQDVGRQQLSQAVSSLETRRTILIRARSRARELSDQIKRLMNDPDFPVAGSLLILPADEIMNQQIRFNLEDMIATAMENRAELGQQQIRIDSAGVAADVAKNNLLPKFDFIGSVGPQGIGGNWTEAFEDQMGWDHIDFTAGLQFEVPIGNRAARAIWRRAQLQRMQAIDQYRLLIDQVSLEVKTAEREVNTTWEERVGTGRAVFAAADALGAIEEREKANEALTPEFVNRKLDLQSQLAQNQQRQAEADSNYMIALAGLERAKGTLLRYNNIIMEQAQLTTAVTAVPK